MHFFVLWILVRVREYEHRWQLQCSTHSVCAAALTKCTASRQAVHRSCLRQTVSREVSLSLELHWSLCLASWQLNWRLLLYFFTHTHTHFVTHRHWLHCIQKNTDSRQTELKWKRKRQIKVIAVATATGKVCFPFSKLWFLFRNLSTESAEKIKGFPQTSLLLRYCTLSITAAAAAAEFTCRTHTWQQVRYIKKKIIDYVDQVWAVAVAVARSEVGVALVSSSERGKVWKGDRVKEIGAIREKTCTKEEKVKQVVCVCGCGKNVCVCVSKMCQ